MDGYSPITFGEFTLEERLSYFSEDSINSCGVEFPDEWNLYLISSSGLYGKQDCIYKQTESEIVSVVENADSSVGLNTKSGLRDLYSQEDVSSTWEENDEPPVDEISLCKKINQVSENEVNCVDKCDTSIKSSVSTPATTQAHELVVCSDETQIESANENNHNELLQNKVANEKSPASAEVRSSESAAETAVTPPTNVVTVGTKTMMTTSMRTVESQNEGVKSSWADLFKPKSSSKPQGPLPQLKPSEQRQQVHHSVEEDSMSRKDQLRQYFLDILKKISLTNHVPALQPRGLKNNGNWCYINSTLQVLLFCPSFYHFLVKFKVKTERGTSQTPILDALVLFASQFSEMPPQQLVGKSRDWSNKHEVLMGIPFEPLHVYKLLTTGKTTLSQQGKQEDAEEFLGCILNGLHDEMVQLAAGHGDKPQQDPTSNHPIADQDWEQVGPRNRSTITRKATISKSPVAAMFGGYLRSSLVQPGMKESASIQPFFTIQLDLRGEVTTVQQAFDNFFRVEEVEGFQCDKSKTEVEVSKKWTLDTLPVVLVLHLKRFVVNNNGCEKLTKKVSYEPLLQVPSDTISKVLKVRSKNMLTYKLFAVTYHHGRNLHGGHYTSDIFHPSAGWLRADDMHVRPVPPKFVFNPLSNRDPYLLYYCRGDIST